MLRKRCYRLWVLIVCIIIAGVQSQEQSRHFHLGFTPFPYDISQEAIDFTYAHIADDADLIVHHFDNGIPWDAALNDTPYSAHIMTDWSLRREKTPPDHRVFLSMTPISFMRDGLALYRDDADDLPLPAPWNDYTFDHPDVKTAYVQHVKRSVDYFQPNYLAIGIEVNLLLNQRPDLWDAYVALQTYTYTELKAIYPDLPIFVSVFGLSYIEGIRDEDDTPRHLETLNRDILPASDFLGVSLYPYMSVYLTETHPNSLFETLFTLTDKPIVITETGYPAQVFSIADGTITMDGTPEKQAAYISRLLTYADEYDIRLIVNFVLRDYDPLWEKIGGGDLAALWRDTGFYDESGNPRPALTIWRDALSRDYLLSEQEKQ